MKAKYIPLVYILSLLILLGGCGASPSSGSGAEEPIKAEVSHPAQSAPSEEDADGSAEAAPAAYRELLQASPAISGEHEELFDAAFDCEQNLAVFGTHYDCFAFWDIDRNGVPELIASTTVNFRWTTLSVFTYANGQVILLADPSGESSHGTLEQRSTANGAYITYICEEDHIHSVWRGTDPTGAAEEENSAYRLEGTTLIPVSCAADESGNVICFSDIAEENTAEEPERQTGALLSAYRDMAPEVSERMQKDCEKLAALCDEPIKTGERVKMPYFPYETVLTQAAVDAVEEKLAEAGYAVMDSDSVYPEYLANPEGLQRLCKAAEKGEAAEESVVSVSEDGTVSYMTFQYDGGSMYYISTSVSWDEAGRYAVSRPTKRELLDWGTAYDRYFYYQLMETDRHWTACLSMRLQPPDRELYGLYRLYLSPAGYPSCLFTKDWDEKSYENVCFNDLFESFCIAATGDCVHPEDYEEYPELNCSLIPADIFENTVLPYFDISLDEFRALSLYRQDRDAYLWKDLDCSNLTYCPELTPEVTGRRDNGDGSITLTVDVLCFDEKSFPRFTHEITVRPTEDGGFQYMANRVTYADEHGVPDTTPRIVVELT